MIEDEQEQEAKESEARRLKKEAEEQAKEEAKRVEEEKRKAEEEKEKVKVGEEKKTADEMLPKEEVSFARATEAVERRGADACSFIVQIKEATKETPEPEAAAPVDPADVRMTSEQVTELGQALEILSAKSSVIKERTELRKLIDENNKAEAEVRSSPSVSAFFADYADTHSLRKLTGSQTQPTSQTTQVSSAKD